jgi:hypothetical protein
MKLTTMTLSDRGVFCFKLLIVLGIVALACTAAFASGTYTYTGSPFDYWPPWNGGACPPVCNVTGSFTVAQALAPNLPEFTPVNAAFASLSSGGATLTLATSVSSVV